MILTRCTLIALLSFFVNVTIDANNLSKYSARDSIKMSPHELIIAKEKYALDRWKTGDTFGFVEIAAEEITYFDPGHEKRFTGKKEFSDWMSSINGTFSFPGYKLLNPQVQMHGNTGVLTFNYEGTGNDGSHDYWNTTEVYVLIDGDWKLISSHWSHTTPKLQKD
ncbi:MAG: nuclear transport factor 2 family protein [Ignavibacteriaceae bacterium]